MYTIERERTALLGRVVTILAWVGLIAYVPSVIASVRVGLIPLAIVDSVAYFLVLGAAAFPRIPFRAKLLAMVGSIFIVGIAVLVMTGPLGAGYLWIMCGVLLSALFGSVRVVIGTIIFSVVALAAYGTLAVMGLLDHPVNPLSLIVIGSNMVTICVVLAYVIHSALGGMEEALKTQELLSKELHHRVKNNLQVTLSLISLEAYGTDPTPSIVALERRVRILTVVNELFLARADTLRLDLRAMARAVSGCAQQWTIVSDDGWDEAADGAAFEIDSADAAHFAIGMGELLSLLAPTTVIIEALPGTSVFPPRIRLRLSPGDNEKQMREAEETINRDATVRSLLGPLHFRSLGEDSSGGPGFEIDAVESGA